VNAVTDALSFVAGLSRAEFDEASSCNTTLFRAVKNAVTEVGEAIKALPAEICDRHAEVDWRGLIGARNIIVH
jgi:uncharacterized protein with HEPN domain